MSVTAVSVRGKPYWQINVWRDGGAFRRRRFLDRRKHLKRDALALERSMIETYERKKQKGAVLQDLSTGDTIFENDLGEGMPTFAVFAQRYLKVQDPQQSDTRNKARNLRLHLIPFFGATPLDQISRMMIDEFKVKLRSPTGEKASHRRSLTRKEKPVTDRRKGSPKSPKTINNILTTLRGVLGLACDYEIIEALPRFKLERFDRRDPGFLDFEEAEIFLAAATPEWRMLMRTAIRTGLRRGELLELRWKDLRLDTDRPTLRVRRSVKYEGGGVFKVKEPKGKRPRSVPLTRELTSALREHRGDAEPGNLVFPAEDGGYRNHNHLYRAVLATAQAAAIKKHVHPHLFRHTFASHCYMRGVPPQVVQKWLGHASVETTQRYAHLQPDTGDELIDLLEEPDVRPRPARVREQSSDLIDRLEDRALDATANTAANRRKRTTKNGA